ncbi:DUF2254 domain-containing protein [Yoonia sp. 208BN28-4]|uniref:DUF2254 domain-containing protein n=1 Tax=Yoonia sp. 208BN28-4 TaxID=3126505 RepID=UPI0030B66871
MKKFLARILGFPAIALRKWQVITEKLVMRVLFMGLLALISLALTNLFDRWLPEALATYVSGDAVDTLLSIIANAMLAVTTFSLTVMVTVYRSSSNQFTPRVHRLIMRDKTTQNTLAAFIGAYVFALTAVIMRELNIFTDDRAALLFMMTVFVLIYVVISMVRWVLHLQEFGSLMKTSRQLEEMTQQHFDSRLANACLGANPWDGEIPDDATAICANETGYVQQIYQDSLNSNAGDSNLEIYMTADIGSFVLRGDPVAHVVCKDCDLDDELEEMIRDHVSIGDMRIYDQDPRFGLIALGEIASKALSPGVNDPGTAIDILTRQVRILVNYIDTSNSGEDEENKITHENLHVRPLAAEDLIMDALGAWSRDGAAIIEVQIRMQKSLDQLIRNATSEMADAAKSFAQTSYDRAFEAMTFAPDIARLNDAASDKIKTREPEKTT